MNFSDYIKTPKIQHTSRRPGLVSITKRHVVIKIRRGPSQRLRIHGLLVGRRHHVSSDPYVRIQLANALVEALLVQADRLPAGLGSPRVRHPSVRRRHHLVRTQVAALDLRPAVGGHARVVSRQRRGYRLRVARPAYGVR